ncbi:MAG: hypothetical protein GTO24_02895 [candidate division Zixibacteria bacterium]|nr:hypothetical protein [candidate division Zixibacteria bacterium]
MLANEKRDYSFFWRLGAFIVLALLADLWASYHIGVGIANPGWLGGIVLVLGTLGKFAGKLLEKAEQESIWGRVRAILRNIFSTPVLIICGLLVGIVALTCSSIIIIPEEHDERLTGDIIGLDSFHGPKAFDQKGLVRLNVTTNPFGRPFQLIVEGYLPETLYVYPIVGVKVKPSIDLRRSPSVLFRPPCSALSSLENGGKILIWRADTMPRSLIAEDKGYRGSFLLGRTQSLPTSYVSRWELELKAASLLEQDVARTLLEWRNPKVLKIGSNTTLTPGMVLESEVQTRAEKIKAKATVTLGNENLVDVPMIKVEE